MEPLNPTGLPQPEAGDCSTSESRGWTGQEHSRNRCSFLGEKEKHLDLPRRCLHPCCAVATRKTSPFPCGFPADGLANLIETSLVWNSASQTQ